jgi:hypothetical protein
MLRIALTITASVPNMSFLFFFTARKIFSATFFRAYSGSLSEGLMSIFALTSVGQVMRIFNFVGLHTTWMSYQH